MYSITLFFSQFRFHCWTSMRKNSNPMRVFHSQVCWECAVTIRSLLLIKYMNIYHLYYILLLIFYFQRFFLFVSKQIDFFPCICPFSLGKIWSSYICGKSVRLPNVSRNAIHLSRRQAEDKWWKRSAHLMLLWKLWKCIIAFLEKFSAEKFPRGVLRRWNGFTFYI